jgi:hypothetical protein
MHARSDARFQETALELWEVDSLCGTKGENSTPNTTFETRALSAAAGSCAYTFGYIRFVPFRQNAITAFLAFRRWLTSYLGSASKAVVPGRLFEAASAQFHGLFTLKCITRIKKS